MSQTLKFGKGTWATKKGSTLAYSDEGGNFKPLPFTYTGAGKGTRVNKEGLIEVVENDRPRIDYLDSEDGVFLLEKASTNLITYSEDFSNQSIWRRVTVNSNSSISSDGTLNADKLNDSTDNNSHYIALDGSFSLGSYSASIFAKKGTLNYLYIWFTGFNGVFDEEKVWFDLDNGTVGNTQSPIEASIEDYGNGWFRCSAKSTADIATSGKIAFGLSNADNVTSFIGSGTDNIYIWGAQVESGNVASSYIPTQGTIQTRVQETASGSGNSEVFNSEQGVLFANIAANANDGTTRLISLSNGSDDNRLNFYYRSTANQILVKSEINNGTPTDIVVDVNNATLFSKFSIKYNSSELKVFNNGFEVGSVSGNFSYPLNSLNVLNFDNTIASGSNNFYGKTKEISYYDEILTDEELEYMTSYRTWEEMVNELNLNIIHNE